jgi:hypothetical protein
MSKERETVSDGLMTLHLNVGAKTLKWLEDNYGRQPNGKRRSYSKSIEMAVRDMEQLLANQKAEA